jgi:hypothetical protein
MHRDKFETFVRSKHFTQGMYILGGVLIVVFIFEAGYGIGYHRAMFVSHWSENYSRNFGGPGMQAIFDERVPNPHGTFGKIISIGSSTLTIANDQQPEQTIEISDDTLIRDHETTLTISKLQNGNYIVVLGVPDEQGEIDAKLIRVIPPPIATTTKAVRILVPQ